MLVDDCIWHDNQLLTDSLTGSLLFGNLCVMQLTRIIEENRIRVGILGAGDSDWRPCIDSCHLW